MNGENVEREKTNFNLPKKEAPDLSRSSLKRLENLVSLLEELSSRNDPAPDLLLKFIKLYLELPPNEKPLLFQKLISDLEVHKKDIEADLQELLHSSDKDPIPWTSLLSELRQKLESPRLEAFRRFINVSGGLKFLLDLRADVLAAQRQFPEELDPLDEEIAHLFNSWFQRGFLFLQEITQDSPYRQISFLKEHDLVHPMASLEQMGGRLGKDRRCFALYHRAMPEEPIIFIEVALTRGLARSIHEIIKDHDERLVEKDDPDTAIFYSINNTQNGLTAIGLGKLLIFQVVDALKKDHPGIKTFATLSPIPGFWNRYLKPILEGKDSSFELKKDHIEAYFQRSDKENLLNKVEQVTGNKASDFPAALKSILSDPQWIEDEDYRRILKDPLSKIAFFYLTQEKNRRGQLLNPVARFHLGNGASVSLKNINFAAKRSPRGLEESCGMMVNYMYSKTWLQQIATTIKSLLPWSKGSKNLGIV